MHFFVILQCCYKSYMSLKCSNKWFSWRQEYILWYISCLISIFFHWNALDLIHDLIFIPSIHDPPKQKDWLIYFSLLSIEWWQRLIIILSKWLVSINWYFTINLFDLFNAMINTSIYVMSSSKLNPLIILDSLYEMIPLISTEYFHHFSCFTAVSW